MLSYCSTKSILDEFTENSYSLSRRRTRTRINGIRPAPAIIRVTVPNLALRVQNLRKACKDVVAVDGLNLQVATGECFGLLGPNGAGKTTTIEICEGLTVPDSGDVHPRT
jgi:ABC-2 type transport system ATP-binding protein